MSGINYECSSIVPDIPKTGENTAMVILRDIDSINDPSSTKRRIWGPGTAKITRYCDGGIDMDWISTSSDMIEACPICGAGIQSHEVVTREYEGTILRKTAEGELIISDKGTLTYEEDFGPHSGAEVYCENDHSDLDMAEHLREQSENV